MLSVAKEAGMRPTTNQRESRIINKLRDIGVNDEHDDIVYPSVLPFMLIHLGCAAAIWSGIT